MSPLPADRGDRRRAASSRAVLAVAGSVALVLIGVAIGIQLGLPMRSDAVPGPDSIEVGFAHDMIVHHEQAVQMATWERGHTTDPVLRQLAFDIETGQSRQIGHMRGWLGLWAAAPLPTGPHMRWMPGDPAGGHGGMPGMGGGAPALGTATMPGMATADQLRLLRASTGPALDVLFLQLMLRHHEGGTAMLAAAAAHASVPDVRNLADRMRTAQAAEIDYLRQLLAERNATTTQN